MKHFTLIAAMLVLLLVKPVTADVCNDISQPHFRNGTLTDTGIECALAALEAESDYRAGLDALYAGEYDTALSLLRPLAESGYAQAQNKLGDMYFNGRAVTQDYREAARLYQQSAKLGFNIAQVNLAVLYVTGQGVLQDYELAHMWANIAAANGVESAIERRDDISRMMSQSSVEKAQTMARSCLQTNYQECGG